MEQLLEGFSIEEPLAEASTSGVAPFANLDLCIRFFASSKHWSAWTVAAAQAGFFGGVDFAPPEWADKLDALERALDRARKAP